MSSFRLSVMGVYSCIQAVFSGVMRFCGTGICSTPTHHTKLTDTDAQNIHMRQRVRHRNAILELAGVQIVWE